VVDDGVPQAELSVSAIGDGVRLDFDCTDEVGSFALELPANTALLLSVRNKDGAELYRDPAAAGLEIGEQQYREIDLTRGAEKPCPEPGPDQPPDATFKMLDLVGRPEAAALSLLANQGLELGERSTVPNADMVGLIVSHVPAAGATVKRGDSVDIVVGASQQVQVPDLIGLTLERAQVLLKKAGLVEGELSQVPVKKERAGLIIEQTPLPGVVADPGSAVKMSIGVAVDEGPDLVTVPDVTGGSVDKADAILKKAGLRRGGTSEVPVPPEKVGLVVGQSPGAGARLPPDTAVALIIGKPAEDDNKITVPDVRGKLRGDAMALLQEAGLTIGDLSEKPTDRVPPDAVLDQSPPPGSSAAAGDEVSLVIATALIIDVPRARVPQVTGIPFDRAEAVLKETGFDSERTEREVTAPAQVDIILAQKPLADSTAESGTTVSLMVGIPARTEERPGIQREVEQIAEITQKDLIERQVLPADEPRGAFTQRLQKAGVKTIADFDKLLTRDRRELRELLGLRTLAQTDQAIRALKRAHKQVVG
jgi:beta-lactam-binding protein with PASTA domain